MEGVYFSMGLRLPAIYNVKPELREFGETPMFTMTWEVTMFAQVTSLADEPDRFGMSRPH